MGFQSGAAAAAGTCPEWAARVVSSEGRVEALSVGDTQWRAVALNDTFCPEDQVRTLERSRAALQLRNETMLRLDQNTMVKFSAIEPESPSLLELITGKAFFMTRFPRPLTIETPYVNASSGGTEYVIEVDKEHQTSTLTVIEGTMHLKNAAGSLTVTDGQSSVTHAGGGPVMRIVVNLKDVLHWALYYPPVLNLRDLRLGGTEGLPETDWRAMVSNSITAYQAGDLERAFVALSNATDNIDDPRFYTYRASLLLAVGRVAEAQSDIERSMTLAPRNGLAFALQSLIAVVQNQADNALSLAQEAVAAEPQSASVRIALSYAWQANFNLSAALTAAQDATNLDPEGALTWARTAELWLSQGYLTEALKAAKRAEALNPHEARIQTVLGFAYLTQIKVKQAQEVFEQAIALNSSDPLPRLGLGLAMIRRGELGDGRKEIEIAAALDPGNSLIRSYLGKAYYEEKRDPKAAIQFDMAKQLDPKDPTPYLYDAIRKQTTNRPIEALQDLQTSIALNDNRAPYRSRLQLDDDLSTRNVSQGRIYADLGFEQAALVEGWKSVNIDPANYSAHRFLSDSYAALPSSNIARLSSLLVSQLLQPVNNDPVQPRLGDSTQVLSAIAGPANVSFNEYSQLFSRDKVHLLASGLLGGNNTRDEELIANGQHGRYSFSIGQSRFVTDGYRPNADVSETNHNIFAQAALASTTSVQAEFRDDQSKSGDLDLRFDPQNYLNDFRREIKAKIYRLGLHHKFNPQSDIIINIFHQDRTEDLDVPSMLFSEATTTKGTGGEAQHLFHGSNLNTIVGAGHYDGKDTEIGSIFGSPIDQESSVHHTNLYVYSMLDLPHHIVMTVGASADSIQTSMRDRDQFNPKFGVMWDITPTTTLRFAGIRALRSPLVSDQTIEPTQVAGFQQFFDDVSATEYKRYGIGIDQKISPILLGGMEASTRNSNIPYELAGTPSQTDDEERLGRAYLAWTPYSWVAAHADYVYERSIPADVSLSSTPEMTTQRVPLGVNLYHPCGIFAKFSTSYVDQKVSSWNFVTTTVQSDSDHFWLVDMAFGYRLPNRLGIASVEVNNLFDRSFQYQDVMGSYPSILPERVVFTKLTLLF